MQCCACPKHMWTVLLARLAYAALHGSADTDHPDVMLLQMEQLERFGVHHVAHYYTAPPATPAVAADITAAPTADAAAAVGGSDVDMDGVGATAPQPAKRVPGVTRIGKPPLLKLTRPAGECP